MPTPLSKFSLGQPVECMWDYNGNTLGVIRGKYWQKQFDMWGYCVRKASGEEFAAFERELRAVRLKVKLNIVRAA